MSYYIVFESDNISGLYEALTIEEVWEQLAGAANYEDVECFKRDSEVVIKEYKYAITSLKKWVPEKRGWDCPHSPDNECDYEQEDGSFDEDNCRYCGQAEERK